MKSLASVFATWLSAAYKNITDWLKSILYSNSDGGPSMMGQDISTQEKFGNLAEGSEVPWVLTK